LLSARNQAHLLFFLLFAAALFATHYRLLDLPFFWDEAGQFIPQSLDLYEHGRLIPKTTQPNSHPPGLPIFLTLVWKITGFSIPVTRGVMLLVMAAFLTASFRLAILLLQGASGMPAFVVAILMLANPLLYTQGLMAQLDLPSALGCVVLMLAFSQGKQQAAVLAALFAVSFKETSIVIPVVLSIFAWRAGQQRFALLLTGLPVLLLANWFAYVHFSTGHLFGDPAYTNYNLFYPLHPARLSYALFRRVFSLAIENFHWIGAAILLWRWKDIGFKPIWKPIFWACLAHTVFVSISGGAVLERYLLPTLPVLYMAFAAAFATLPRTPRFAAVALSAAGLFAGIFWNPPYPYALENNLAMVDMIDMHRNAAGLVEAGPQQRRVTTAWPLTDGLRRPELGYLETAHKNVRSIDDFSVEGLNALDWQPGEMLILYSRSWNPPHSIARWPWVRSLLRQYFRAPEDIRHDELGELRGLRSVVGYEQRGFWIEILMAEPAAGR
jgi:hypothetical protein